MVGQLHDKVKSLVYGVTSALLALEHVPSNQVSKWSFKTEEHPLVTSFAYLPLLLHLQSTQLSQSSVTKLSLGPSKVQQVG